VVRVYVGCCMITHMLQGLHQTCEAPEFDAGCNACRFELPGMVIFHTANAWQEGDIVKLVACTFDEVRI
jgi:Retinal pigment epithelial membrane protein